MALWPATSSHSRPVPQRQTRQILANASERAPAFLTNGSPVRLPPCRHQHAKKDKQQAGPIPSLDPSHPLPQPPALHVIASVADHSAFDNELQRLLQHDRLTSAILSIHSRPQRPNHHHVHRKPLATKAAQVRARRDRGEAGLGRVGASRYLYSYLCSSMRTAPAFVRDDTAEGCCCNDVGP